MQIDTMHLNPSSFNYDSLFSVHSDFAAKMRQKFNMPEFIKLRSIFCRKQVQIAFFGNYLSAWEELAHKTYRKPHSFFEHRQLIVDMMKQSYLPQLEEYYRTSITHFYIFEPHYLDNLIYGFTAKLFSAPLFKSIDAHQAPLEEKLSNAFAARLRQQYGRGPAQTTAAILDSRFLFFAAAGLVAPFPQHFAQTHPGALDITTTMLKELILDSVDFVCRQHYGQTFETFIEIDLAGNQVIALTIVEPLTAKDLTFA